MAFDMAGTESKRKYLEKKAKCKLECFGTPFFYRQNNNNNNNNKGTCTCLLNPSYCPPAVSPKPVATLFIAFLRTARVVVYCAR